MNGGRDPSGAPEPARLAAIALAVVTMGIVLYTFAPPGRVAPSRPGPPGASAPIPAEALVFRTRAQDLGVAPDGHARPDAQLRTLATYRKIREYPGAPPRVPHGLTEDEYRGTRCNTCHQRGGYVERFGRYAPVTPHPEYTQCLQCHSVDAMRVGITRTGNRPNVVCTQCHVDPDRKPPSLVSLDWVAEPWPTVVHTTAFDSPPPIPHRLQMRGNCIACHAGPGSVQEVRTPHPDRANCRQCHVAVDTDSTFVRGDP